MPTAASDRRIEIYDTTLRDGTQGLGVALSLGDKLKLARLLDSIGVDYIEGGYPLSNPKDVAFFEEARRIPWQHAKICAFGMTRRKGITAAEDPGMQALVAAETPVVTIVGKTWDLHVDQVLRISREENLAMIRESLAFCVAASHRPAVFYDAEHFFDGYRANPDYALATLKAAIAGGARRLVLCDTNGGSLPGWITQVVGELRARLDLATSVTDTARPALAVHPHNDCGVAVANALAAVEAGCVQVQGTINGIGERCGNVDLVPVICNLGIKLGHAVLLPEALPRMTEVARAVYTIAALPPQVGQPYVGPGAFAHKGGMHVHAVQRIAHSYEHITPEAVGNQRRVLVSELSGASNIVAALGEKFALGEDRALQRTVLEKVQDLEHAGYQFEDAQASLELLVYDALGRGQSFWALDHYRCVIQRRSHEEASTEATVKLAVGETMEHRVAEGHGPIDALTGALRKCLREHYPQIQQVHLVDYSVRAVNPTAETAAKVRVLIEFSVRDPQGVEVRHFSTIGVSENIVSASWLALSDAFRYHLQESALAEA